MDMHACLRLPSTTPLFARVYDIISSVFLLLLRMAQLFIWRTLDWLCSCTTVLLTALHCRVYSSVDAAVRTEQTEASTSENEPKCTALNKQQQLLLSTTRPASTQRKTHSLVLRCRSISHAQERAALPKSSLLQLCPQPCLPSQRDGDSWRLDSL